MPSSQQPPRKRRCLTPEPDDSNASKQTTHQGAPTATSPNILPYRSSQAAASTQTSNVFFDPNTTDITNVTPSLVLPPPPISQFVRSIRPQPLTLPPCLPHLQSPCPGPTPPNLVMATLDEKAGYNMEFMEWKRLDIAWRRERLLRSAAFMFTWRQTMINMVYICYEGQYWAMREAGVQMGLIAPESRTSLRRRIVEGLQREREIAAYTLEELNREGRRQRERMERMLWKR